MIGKQLADVGWREGQAGLAGWAMRLGCALLLGAALLRAGAGCAALSEATGEPEAVSAQYVPNKLDPMLILVECYSNPGLHQIDADQLTQFVYEDLKAHQVAPLIDPADLEQLREAKGPVKMRQMKIGQIARELGAKQVFYVNILDSGVENIPREAVQGRLALRARVVDAHTGLSLWPTDAEEGYPVEVETPLALTSQDVTNYTTRDKLLRSAAQRVAHLLYEYKPEE